MQKENKLFISVIIPFKDGHHYLGKIVPALLEQSYKPYEIIFVDDGSHMPLRESDLITLPNACIIRLSENKGPAYARNVAIRASKGDIIAFTDIDCTPPPSWLSTIEFLFRKNDVNIIAGGASIPDAKGLSYLISLLGYPAGANLGFDKMWNVAPSGFTEHISACNFAIKRNCLLSHNLYFDEIFPYAACEDLAFANKCINAGQNILFSPDITVAHAPISSLFSFLKWHFNRGRSLHYCSKVGIKLKPILIRRFKTFLVSLKIAKHFWKCFLLSVLFGLQCIMQVFGKYHEKFHNG